MSLQCMLTGMNIPRDIEILFNRVTHKVNKLGEFRPHPPLQNVLAKPWTGNPLNCVQVWFGHKFQLEVFESM